MRAFGPDLQVQHLVFGLLLRLLLWVVRGHWSLLWLPESFSPFLFSGVVWHLRKRVATSAHGGGGGDALLLMLYLLCLSFCRRWSRGGDSISHLQVV